MANSMCTSPWDLPSAVKLRQFSRCIQNVRQYPLCMRSFSEKKFLYTPMLLYYGSRGSKNRARWPMIVARTDSTEETQPQKPKPVLKRAPLTAREKLRAARVLSKYTESKPIKPAMGSKILDALRETDKGKKRSGLPEAPTNLFDDSNRGLEQEGWRFQLPGGLCRSFQMQQDLLHEYLNMFNYIEDIPNSWHQHHR